MNPEVFAEWFRRQGQNVVRTLSSYWVENAPGAYQAFPYHWMVAPAEDELTHFLQENRAVTLRYSTCWDAPFGIASYHAVTGRDYSMKNLGHWARKNVRRGLKNCQVEPISLVTLADIGWELQKDTLTRQGRWLKFGRSQWQTLCLSAAELPGFNAWGAFVRGMLAASVITFQMDDWAYMLYQQCLNEYLSLHVNNALAYVVTSKLLEDEKMNSILYGLHSLDAPASVDEFKFRMGYTAKPVRQRVVFHPFARPLVNPVSHTALKLARHFLPGDPVIAKTEGMLRFYLQGRRPVTEQEWPGPVKMTPVKC